MKLQDYQDPYNPDLDACIYHDIQEQFLEVSAKVLPKLKIASVIGKGVWDKESLAETF